MTNRIAEAARRAAETLESRAFHGMTPTERRAQPLAEAYRQGRIYHPEPVDKRCWLDPAGWAPDGAAALRRHPNCRCGLDPGDPVGDCTVVSFQGPDGSYHLLPNIAIVGIGIVAHGELSGVPADVEPLAPPPTWLRKYRPR